MKEGMKAYTIYKIRRNSDGLFSKGGAFPAFSKAGKIWKNHVHLQAHLRLVLYGPPDARQEYDDCHVVSYQVIERIDSDADVAVSTWLDKIEQKNERIHQQVNDVTSKERIEYEFKKFAASRERYDDEYNNYINHSRRDIDNALNYWGSYSNNIISLTLQGVAKRYDNRYANMLIDEFDLESHGWEKEPANCDKL